jgi:methionyl-tRNA synthetase
VTYGGRKLSKSAGVTFDLDEAIQRHGPEALRYYLLREVPWNGDGDITRERFDERYNSELANDIGNLASRTLAMIKKYRKSVIPAGESLSLDAAAREAVEKYRKAMDESLIHQGIAAALELTSLANGFVETQAPWALAKDPEAAAELDATLASLARALLVLATLLQPILPEKMDELARSLGVEGVPTLDEALSMEMAGKAVTRGDPLFPRTDLGRK